MCSTSCLNREGLRLGELEPFRLRERGIRFIKHPLCAVFLWLHYSLLVVCTHPVIWSALEAVAMIKKMTAYNIRKQDVSFSSRAQGGAELLRRGEFLCRHRPLCLLSG